MYGMIRSGQAASEPIVLSRPALVAYVLESAMGGGGTVERERPSRCVGFGGATSATRTA